MFVNTADILILNTCKFLKLKDPSSDVEKNIVNAVKIIRDIIQNDQELKAMPPAGLTKNQLVYTKISEYMK
ncbi:hypothetical protein B645_01255 [Enterococcus hirae 88-15-E09]|nr:hypothetical protein B645_01255 [Enterococcus hirae 88-15-E09]